MEYRCKNALCNTTDESRFYKNNKTSCKNCLKQRRDITKKTKQIVDNDDVQPSPKTGVFDSTVKNIIIAQQKMLEHQQRQTDALFSLAEKLLEKVNNVDRFSTVENRPSPIIRNPARTPVSKAVVSHTPRRRQNLVHYKDRLNTDI
jgi:hypothetical protein